tara:strand:- start:594 stop:794 length:201 start_codon:yes stop_codon:yes gene_type:complete
MNYLDLANERLAYSRQETAKLLGVSPITIDRLAKRGLLRPSRAIRRPLYSKAEIQRFLNETEGKVS